MKNPILAHWLRDGRNCSSRSAPVIWIGRNFPVAHNPVIEAGSTPCGEDLWRVKLPTITMDSVMNESK